MQAIVLNTSFNVDPLTQFQDARQIFETALSQAESDKYELKYKFETKRFMTQPSYFHKFPNGVAGIA